MICFFFKLRDSEQSRIWSDHSPSLETPFSSFHFPSDPRMWMTLVSQSGKAFSKTSRTSDTWGDWVTTATWRSLHFSAAVKKCLKVGRTRETRALLVNCQLPWVWILIIVRSKSTAINLTLNDTSLCTMLEYFSIFSAKCKPSLLSALSPWIIFLVLNEPAACNMTSGNKRTLFVHDIIHIELS